jgi:hypothetical protein
LGSLFPCNQFQQACLDGWLNDFLDHRFRVGFSSCAAAGLPYDYLADDAVSLIGFDVSAVVRLRGILDAHYCPPAAKYI